MFPEIPLFLPDRDVVSPSDYSQFGSLRIDCVHMDLSERERDPKYFLPRELEIIKRMQRLRDLGMCVVEVGLDLYENLDDVDGKIIIIAGEHGHFCCEERAENIRNHGGFPIIDRALIYPLLQNE